ncbi:O-antigen polymerase [Peribacillus frigoritolerans]|uniref:O-antigen polymerase n=1 Tax=Peribacillus frigoritolerans TaxID=450367 RepID=UPI002283182A|nr:O-antigen polymerase [Peribacillus frigoritolerans]MCY9140974.1 oligosaccharide repeat unit polymerase [Peribacillus frigoritolerans]
METIIYIILLILSFFITYIKFKALIKINTIYTFLWGAVGLLSKLDFLNIVKPSIQVHIYIWISIILFNFIYLVLCKNIYNKEFSIQKYKVNYSYIYILNLIAFVIISPLFVQACIGIVQNGFGNYRGSIFEIASDSNLTIFINRIVIAAIFDATALIAAAELVQGRKKLIKWSIIGIILYTITFGGRYSIMNFIVYYLGAFILLKKYKTVRIKIKKRYFILGILALIMVTVGRGTGDTGIFGMILLYFVGSLSYLQVILNNPYQFGLFEHTYGGMTFAFIVEPITLALKALFSFNIDTPSYYFNIYMQPFINIGTNGSVVMYNNNSTFFYNFLRDFGVVGIVIGITFIAATCAILENHHKKGNTRSMLFLIFMIGLIMTSSMKYSLLTSKAILIVFIIIWVTKKKKKEEL